MWVGCEGVCTMKFNLNCFSYPVFAVQTTSDKCCAGGPENKVNQIQLNTYKHVLIQSAVFLGITKPLRYDNACVQLGETCYLEKWCWMSACMCRRQFELENLFTISNIVKGALDGHGSLYLPQSTLRPCAIILALELGSWVQIPQ